MHTTPRVVVLCCGSELLDPTHVSKELLQFIQESTIKSLRPSDAYICVGNLAIMGTDQATSHHIVWTNAGLLLSGPLGTNFSEILTDFHRFWFKKMHPKRSSANWRPFFPGLNVLRTCLWIPENTYYIPSRTKQTKPHAYYMGCTVYQEAVAISAPTPTDIHLELKLCKISLTRNLFISLQIVLKICTGSISDVLCAKLQNYLTTEVDVIYEKVLARLEFKMRFGWIHDDVIKWKHFSVLLAICAGNS